MPTSAATARATPALSPVSSTGRRPSPRTGRPPRPRSSLTVSATTMSTPAKSPSTRPDGGSRRLACGRGSAGRVREVDPPSRAAASRPAITVCPAITALRPRSRRRLMKSLTAGRAFPRPGRGSRAALVTARAIGCSEAASTAPASRQQLRPRSLPVAATMPPTTRELARGHRAGLVQDHGVDPRVAPRGPRGRGSGCPAARRGRCPPAARWGWPARARRGRR